MVLAANIINLITDEIGLHEDFSETTSDYDPANHLGDIETIYLDENRGNSDPLRTALIVWRLRLYSHLERSFDLTTEGSLLSRRQKIRFMEQRVKELEMLVDTTLRGRNMSVTTNLSTDADLLNNAEFSA